MANLSVHPYEYDITAVAPGQTFNAVAGRMYTNRIGGDRFHLNARWLNLPYAKFALLRRDILKLIQNSTLTNVPTDGDNRAEHLEGNGYIWVDFGKLNIPRSTTRRTIIAANGANLALNAAVPDDVQVAEFITIGSQLMSVVSFDGTRLTVWPRPLYDVVGEPIFSEVDGLWGGWFEMPGDAPVWSFKPAKVYHGGPIQLDLQAAI